MADTTLILGGITFQDFEIPEEIAFGGEQALSIKKLLGGARIIDALGQDDADLTWSGRFQSPDAMARAWALDELRKGGQQQTMTVAGLSYTVVVQRFVYRVQKLYQVLYEIVLAVVQDDSIGPPASLASLDDVVGADMTSVNGLLSGITNGSIAPAVAGLSGAISSLGTLEGATLTALAPVAIAAANLTSIANGVIDTVDSTIQTNIGAVAGIVSGGFAPDMISTFQDQVDSIGQMASLKGLVALASRIQTNIAQATG